MAEKGMGSISDSGSYMLYPVRGSGQSAVGLKWRQPAGSPAETEWLMSHGSVARGQIRCTTLAVVPTGEHIDLACSLSLKEELARFPDSWWWWERKGRQELSTRGQEKKRKRGIKYGFKGP